MLISSVLTAAALLSFQADPIRAPRDAYTRCLFAYADKAVEDRMEAAQFESGFPGQCQREERAFRDAIRSANARMPAAEVEEIQEMEIEDARLNTKGRYEAAQPQ